MANNGQDQNHITIGLANPSVKGNAASAAPASADLMSQIVWYAPSEITHLVIPEDMLRHKLTALHVSDNHLVWASTASGLCLPLVIALFTTSMPPLTRGVFIAFAVVSAIGAVIEFTGYFRDHKAPDQIVDDLKQNLTRQPHPNPLNIQQGSGSSPSMGS